MPATATDRLAGVLTSTAVKPPCVAVTSFDIPLTGLYTIGGIPLQDGDRVLVRAQTDASENGIYNATSSDWARALDFDGARDVVPGTLVLVSNSIAKGAIYEVVASGAIVIGETDITFSLRDDPAITYQQTQAEITAGVVPVNTSYPMGYVYRYGLNLIPGTTDMSAAINAAFAIQGIEVQLPPETCYVNSNLATPVCDSVRGYGRQMSIIKCGPAVTKCLSITGAATAKQFRDFQIQGNATAGALGIVIGDGSLTSNITLHNLYVKSFTGSSAANMKIDQVVSVLADNVQLELGTRNLISGITPSLPTNVCFLGGTINAAAFQGALISSGHNVAFRGTVIETNGAQAIYAPTATGCKIEDLLLDHVWLEDNYHNHIDTGAQVFDVEIDGSTAPCNIIVRDTRFAHGSNASGDRRSLHVFHANAWLENMRCYFGFNPEIVVNGNVSYVQLVGDSADRMARFVSNPDKANVIYPIYNTLVDNGDGTSTLPGAWQSWTPTYSSSVGNAAATFSGAVTTTKAKYCLIGKTCTVIVSFTGTLSAVTPSYIQLSLPTSVTPVDNNTFGQGEAIDATTGSTGLLQALSAGAIKLSKDNNSTNWGSGHVCAGNFSFTFDVA